VRRSIHKKKIIKLMLKYTAGGEVRDSREIAQRNRFAGFARNQYRVTHRAHMLSLLEKQVESLHPDALSPVSSGFFLR
jgi:hypothetical protein